MKIDTDLILSAYKTHTLECSEILARYTSEPSHELLVDLYATTYTVVRSAAEAAQCGESVRRSIDLAIQRFILPLVDFLGATPQHFYDRANFYSSVTTDVIPHGHALPITTEADGRPTFRCARAFCDCCLYPPYMEDYQCPSPMLSAMDVLKCSTELIDPLLSQLDIMFLSVAHYCKTGRRKYIKSALPTLQIASNLSNVIFVYFRGETPDEVANQSRRDIVYAIAAASMIVFLVVAWFVV